MLPSTFNTGFRVPSLPLQISPSTRMVVSSLSTLFATTLLIKDGGAGLSRSVTFLGSTSSLLVKAAATHPQLTVALAIVSLTTLMVPVLGYAIPAVTRHCDSMEADLVKSLTDWKQTLLALPTLVKAEAFTLPRLPSLSSIAKHGNATLHQLYQNVINILPYPSPSAKVAITSLSVVLAATTLIREAPRLLPPLINHSITLLSGAAQIVAAHPHVMTALAIVGITTLMWPLLNGSIARLKSLHSQSKEVLVNLLRPLQMPAAFSSVIPFTPRISSIPSTPLSTPARTPTPTLYLPHTSTPLSPPRVTLTSATPPPPLEAADADEITGENALALAQLKRSTLKITFPPSILDETAAHEIVGQYNHWVQTLLPTNRYILSKTLSSNDLIDSPPKSSIAELSSPTQEAGADKAPIIDRRLLLQTAQELKTRFDAWIDSLPEPTKTEVVQHRVYASMQRQWRSLSITFATFDFDKPVSVSLPLQKRVYTALSDMMDLLNFALKEQGLAEQPLAKVVWRTRSASSLSLKS